MSELTPETPPGEAEAQRVTRSGIAVVHVNEVILPAAGSEAEAEQVVDDARATVVYHFPFVVEVRDAPVAPDTHSLREAALTSLSQGLA
jgi:hypothetical protein